MKSHLSCKGFFTVLVSMVVLGQAAWGDSIIHESATLGWTGVWGGWRLDSSQFSGSRFHVDHQVEVTKIGGHMSGTGDFFGAIISLSSWGSLPQGSPFTESEVVASVVFTPHSPSTDYRTGLSVVLEPGDYALVFGSGQLGASGGDGFMAYLLQENLPGSSYFFWDGSNWYNTNPNPPPRLVVEGITEVTISGYVRTSEGEAVEDVPVSADNGGGSDVTDAAGHYELTVLYNWSGTVTPTRTGWDFDPESRAYSNVTEDLTEQDYTALPPVMISGHIVDDESAGVEGVAISADNGGGSDTTDANGFYEIAVPYAWSGTVTPAKTGWGFSPESRTYSSVESDQTDQDYTGFPPPKISGYVRTSGGEAIEDVSVSADNGGGSDVTDANGYYELTVAYNWSGTVTPTKTGWGFGPESRACSNVTNDLTEQDYTGFPPPKISGYILASAGGAMEDVSVSADNGGGSDVTDANGHYKVTVAYNWSGTVTPTKTGWGFEPESREHTNVTGDLTNQDYTGFPPPKISGCVRAGDGGAMEDVSVSADNGGGSDVTDANGYYEVTVAYNWSGTVTPAKTGWGFGPESRGYSSVTGDLTEQDYTGFPPPKISGYVTGGGGSIEGVTVSADNGGGADITNSEGYYELAVAYNWSGRVTPSKEGLYFEPVNRTYTNVTSDLADQDYDERAGPARTFQTEVSGAYNDGYAWSDTSQDVTGSELRVGNDGYPPPYYLIGLRFTNVDVPKKAVISSAFVRLYRKGRVGIGISGEFSGEASDNPPDFSDVKISQRSSGIRRRYTQGSPSTNRPYTSPDLFRIVAEIIDRPGWSLGNAMVILYGTRADAREWVNFHSSRSYLDEPPRLTVSYEYPPKISGYVATSEGAGVADVLVDTDNGGMAVVTETNGYYELRVPPGWTGKVTVSKPYYVFDVNERPYTNLYSDREDVNFTAFAPSTISGRVRGPNGIATPDVLVSADTTGGSDITDANGYYELPVPYGWSGAVTPSRTPLVFDPNQRLYQDITSDEPNQDYTSFVPAIFSVSPNDFDFVAATDDPYPPDQILYISNEGQIALRWEITKPNDCNWLTILPMTGESADEVDEVVLSVYAAELAPGSYSCDLTISDPNAQNSPQIIPVDLRVYGPVISVSPNDVLFRVYADGPNSAEQILYISNTGVDVLHWEVTVPTGCEWLDVYPLSGECSGEVDEVLLSVDADGLDSGSYSCVLTVSDSNAENSPQIVQIGLLAFVSQGQIYVPVEFPTIQEAVDVAVDGDEVVVVPGSYTGPGNFDIHYGGKAITVRSIDPNDAAIVAATIIDGGDSHQGEGGFGFVFTADEGPNSVVDGLTITGASWGGGVYLRQSSPTIRNCIIRDNYGNGILGDVNGPAVITDCIIRGNSGGEWGGGGITLWGTGSITISGCIISGNHGYWWGEGGGIGYHYWEEDGLPPAAMTVSDSVITGNSSVRGGAVYWEAGTLTIADCSISDNTAQDGGGVYCESGMCTISNCTIADNVAAEFGGGMHCAHDAGPTITNCNITGNSSGEAGGGIHWAASGGTISKCTISNNLAAFLGGAICCEGPCSPMLTNCIMSGNKAEYGAVVEGCFWPLTNCTIVGNLASSDGVIRYFRGPVSNCIIWANRTAGDVLVQTPPPVYSCVEGGSEGTGCISSDPCFAVPGYWHPNSTPGDANDDFWVDGDYHLKSGAGRWCPSIYAKLAATDDGFVDLLDFSAFGSYWRQKGGFLPADLDYTGFVDTNDLKLLLEDYMTSYEAGVWVADDVNSPCIDAGYPNSDWTAELWPHGKRINMGAYGGTPQASMSLSSAGNVADINGDDVVNFRDFAYLGNSWQIEGVLLAEDVDGNGAVDYNDVGIFGDNWLWEE